MATDDGDDLVPFLDVRVISSTAPALLCHIAGRSVWLPRRHVAGKLWCAGDRGKLFIRRWVALERRLIGTPQTGAVLPLIPSPAPPRAAVPLRIIRRDRETSDA